jgi:thioredoxin 1
MDFTTFGCLGTLVCFGRLMYIGGCMAAAHLSKSNFDETIKQGVSLVDFWAEWCGPCKMAAPVIEELSNEYVGKIAVAKLDVDAEPEIAESHQVMSIPTIILFKDGKEIGRQVGFGGKQAYLNLLQKAGL